jgi:hypothetical protein
MQCLPMIMVILLQSIGKNHKMTIIKYAFIFLLMLVNFYLFLILILGA